MQDFKCGAKGSVIEKQGFGSTGSSTNKEVQNTVDLKKIR